MRARSDQMTREWPDLLHWPEGWRRVMGESTLRVEEYLDDGTLVVRAELPGVDPEKDVEVSVDGGMLRIRAERRESSAHQDKRGYRSEFRYGGFSRVVSLPAGTTEDDVTASYADGILEVRVQVDDNRARTKKIAVERR